MQPYERPGSPVRVSANGGALPRWSRSGDELYYAAGSAIMAASVRHSPAFAVEPPRVLFELTDERLAWYDVAADGRFIVAKHAGSTRPTTPLRVVIGWRGLLDAE